MIAAEEISSPVTSTGNPCWFKVIEKFVENSSTTVFPSSPTLSVETSKFKNNHQ